MKTREEIEKYLNDLGIEIKSIVRNIPYNENGILTFKGYGTEDPNQKYFSLKTIDKDTEKALLKLVKESILKGNYETAVAAMDVLQEESERYKVNRNSAVNGIPFEEKIKFFSYCHKHNIGEEHKETLSAYISVKQRKENDKDDEER